MTADEETARKPPPFLFFSGCKTCNKGQSWIQNKREIISWQMKCLRLFLLDCVWVAVWAGFQHDKLCWLILKLFFSPFAMCWIYSWYTVDLFPAQRCSHPTWWWPQLIKSQSRQFMDVTARKRGTVTVTACVAFEDFDDHFRKIRQRDLTKASDGYVFLAFCYLCVSPTCFVSKNYVY